MAVPDRAEATASELGQVTVQQGPIKSGSIQLGMWATMRVKIVLAGPKSLATKEILCASGGGGSQLRTRLQPPNSLLAGKIQGNPTVWVAGARAKIKLFQQLGFDFRGCTNRELARGNREGLAGNREHGKPQRPSPLVMNTG